jgi:hypothetical protein
MNQCNYCNKKYSTYKNLWRHIKNYHDKDNLEYKCNYCTKTYKHYQSKTRHEKSCNKNNNIIKVEEDDKKTITNITNNTINNNINNVNNIVNIHINPAGSEDINCLTYDDIKHIFTQDYNKLIKLIELINFNEKHPENHTFCNTSLEGKYVNVINSKNNKVEKHNKTDFFDFVLLNALNNMELIFYKIKNTISKKKSDELLKLINDTKYLHIVNKKANKAARTQINQISYNNKDMIQNTWKAVEVEDKGLDDEILDNDEETINNEEEKINNKEGKINNAEEKIESSNSESSDSSDSEDSFYINKKKLII